MTAHAQGTLPRPSPVGRALVLAALATLGIRQQVVAAIQAESRRYTSDDIYANRQTLLSIQQEIGSTLKDRLDTVLGGEFFCVLASTLPSRSTAPALRS